VEQVIGWLVGVGIVVAVPAAIGFFVLGRRTHGRGVMVGLGIVALLLGVFSYMQVVQGRSLNSISEMGGVGYLITGYLVGFLAAALAATAIGAGLGWTAGRQRRWGFALVLLGSAVPLAASVGLFFHYLVIGYTFGVASFFEEGLIFLVLAVSPLMASLYGITTWALRR
jgi:hypothetical protein